MSDSSDCEAPEEVTHQEVAEKHQETNLLLKENKSRVEREAKEQTKNRKWGAQKSISKSSGDEGSIEDVKETEESIEDAKEETETGKLYVDDMGFLSDDLVKLLAAREKKVFTSDSEEEEEEEEEQPKKKSTSLKKRKGLQAVVLDELPPAHCVQSSLDFLKKRKMQVSRSSAVLKNSCQALRLISTSGLLSKK